MKKLNVTLLFLGLGFLGYLVWRVGPGVLWQQVAELGWGIIPLILSEGAANLAHTLGWRNCLQKTHSCVPLSRLFRMAMAGFAINYLLPTASVGGEASRAALLAANGPVPAAISSVLLDKLSTAIAHLALALLGVVFVLYYAQLPSEVWIAMAISTLLLAAGMAGFLLMQRHGKLGAVLRWLTDRQLGGALALQATRHVSEVDEALKQFYRERPLDFALSIGWHTLGHSAAIFQAWLFLWLIHHPATLPQVACAGCFALWCDLLTFAIPLNLGALEGSRILSLKAIGNSAPVGMAFGVSVRITQVFWACFGLISYAFLTVRKANGLTATSVATVPTQTEPRAS